MNTGKTVISQSFWCMHQNAFYTEIKHLHHFENVIPLRRRKHPSHESKVLFLISHKLKLVSSSKKKCCYLLEEAALQGFNSRQHEKKKKTLEESICKCCAKILKKSVIKCIIKVTSMKAGGRSLWNLWGSKTNKKNIWMVEMKKAMKHWDTSASKFRREHLSK